jgi:dihydrofolate reductase
MSGKVVVNRSMSLDGFIAGPGDAMDWVFDFIAPDEFPEIAAATGAMLIGRRTYEVGKRMAAANPNDVGYPFSGPEFVLTHEPPDPPDPAVTFLTGDIGAAVATALDAAGGKNLEILGADVAGQCLQRGLVDEILV